MSKFIKCKDLDGTTLYLNFDMVQKFRDDEYGTILTFRGDDTISISGKAAELFLKLAENQ